MSGFISSIKAFNFPPLLCLLFLHLLLCFCSHVHLGPSVVLFLLFPLSLPLPPSPFPALANNCYYPAVHPLSSVFILVVPHFFLTTLIGCRCPLSNCFPGPSLSFTSCCSHISASPFSLLHRRLDFLSYSIIHPLTRTSIKALCKLGQLVSLPAAIPCYTSFCLRQCLVRGSTASHPARCRRSWRPHDRLNDAGDSALRPRHRSLKHITRILHCRLGADTQVISWPNPRYIPSPGPVAPHYRRCCRHNPL